MRQCSSPLSSTIFLWNLSLDMNLQNFCTSGVSCAQKLRSEKINEKYSNECANVVCIQSDNENINTI